MDPNSADGARPLVWRDAHGKQFRNESIKTFNSSQRQIVENSYTGNCFSFSYMLTIVKIVVYR